MYCFSQSLIPDLLKHLFTRSPLLRAGCLLLATTTLASAQDRLTPAGVNRLVLTRNPELQAARGILAEAEARARGTGRLANPELGLEVAGGRDFEGRIEAGLTQWFPVTARLRWEKHLSTLEISAAQFEIAEKERQFLAAAQTALVELAAAHEAASLDSRLADAAQKEARALEAHAAAGQASSLDTGTARLAAGELALAESARRAEATAAAEKLTTLLGLPLSPIPDCSPLGLPASPPARHTAINRPTLELAELALARGDAEISLARASKWQDIGLGLFVEAERSRDEPEGIDSEGLLGMRISVPFPLWQNGAAKVREKQAARKTLEYRVQAAQRAIRNEVDAAWRMLQLRHAAASAASRMVPAAKNHLADTEAAFQRGEIDRTGVFRARERAIEIERADLDARKAYHLARIQWLAATGTIVSHP